MGHTVCNIRASKREHRSVCLAVHCKIYWHLPQEEKEVPFMNGLEALQVQINTVLGELIHVGSSMSSTIAYGMGMF